MNRRQLLLRSFAAGVAAALPTRSARAASSDRLLIYFAKGGWDVSFVFDPHFGSSVVEQDPRSTLGTVGGLSFADADSRPAVRQFFEQHGSRACIVNGIAVGSISHSQCERLMFTGSRRADAPDLATRLGAAIGLERPLPTLVVSGPRFPGTLGATTTPLGATLLGTMRGTLPTDGTYDPDAEARLRVFLAEEAAALRADGGGAMADRYADGLSRLDGLEAGIEGVELQQYARWRDTADAAIAALSNGLSQVVVLEGSVPLLSQWDSHVSNDRLQDKNFEHAFGELSQVMQLLRSREAPGGGTLDERTTVLVLSEMGRTPVHNGNDGKDHWPFTSALVVGAGVSGGRVVGATDDTLSAVAVDPDSGDASESGSLLTPAGLAAGLLERFGVDPGEDYAGVAPFRAPFA